MKLASLRAGRDGILILVDRELKTCCAVPEIASTVQAAFDDWAVKSPLLHAASERLNSGRITSARPFDANACAAPLPRAHHWVDGSAYVNHVELVRKARGAEMPASFWLEPLVYQGGSDHLLGPTDDAYFGSEDFGIDMEAEVAVITDEVPMGTSSASARGHIQLLTLANDWSLRNLIPGELAKGFGFYQSKPATAFAPVAVTPDELGSAWRHSKLHLPLVTRVNGALFGAPNAGIDMTFDFSQLIEHVTRTRRLSPGTIIGSGTVSNYDRSHGSSCIVERRMLELIEQGAPMTSFLRFGDRVRIEMFDAGGKSIFGAIDQTVAAAEQISTGTNTRRPSWESKSI